MNKNNNLSRRKFLSFTAQGVIISSFLPTLLQAATNTDSGNVSKMINTIKKYSDTNDYIKNLKLFTDTYKKYTGISKSLREVECLRVQYPMWIGDIQKNDLFVGRVVEPYIGFMPQSKNSFGYYFNEDGMNCLKNSNSTTPENKKIIEELISFWKKENSHQKTRDIYTKSITDVLTSEKWMQDPVIGAPLYRMSGTQIDFDKIIRLGIYGLKKEVLDYQAKEKKGSKKYDVYSGMEKALDLFTEVANYFADQAANLIPSSTPNRKKELLAMEKVLRKIAIEKPESMREAIQLTFLYVALSGSINYGRMDEYLGDLYVNDLINGSLTKDEAKRLLGNLWRLIDAKKNVYDSRVIVGGKGRRNEKNADKFALMAMKVTEETKTVVPQFTLRFYDGQNPVLYEKALDLIGTGNPYPMIYNDDVNIPSVMKAFNLPYNEAVDYLPFGCGEYIIDHRSVGTPSGVINLLQALSVTLHKGVNPVNHKRVGISEQEIGSFDTYDKLVAAYKKNVELYIEQLAWQEKYEYNIAGEVAPFLYLSMGFDDCIKRGKGIFDGGIRYLGGVLESYGNTNTADSFAAIKKLVYDDKKLTLKQVIAAIDSNFEGYEKERQMMLDAPKYGNDDNYADDIIVEVDRHVFETARNMAKKVGLDSYLIVIINNNANTLLGQHTAATPDGRKAFTYMANANNPTGGADKNGITAFLNSLVKPSTYIHAGAVQNMTYSKKMFGQYRPKLEALLKTYWEKGGAQCMINCLGRDDLKMAMKYPKKYPNLIVRVGGFSARFVELAPEVQREILSRTLY